MSHQSEFQETNASRKMAVIHEIRSLRHDQNIEDHYLGPQWLQEMLLDDSASTGLDGEQRLNVLTWCTALTALPCGGLDSLVTIKYYEGADDGSLPVVHTCSREVHLPAFANPSTELYPTALPRSHY